MTGHQLWIVGFPQQQQQKEQKKKLLSFLPGGFHSISPKEIKKLVFIRSVRLKHE